MLLKKPPLSWPCCVFGGHGHAGRPSHDPSSMLLLSQNLTMHGPIHPLLNTVQSSCPLCKKKHSQSMMFPPPCFTVGMVFLGLYSSFFLQTWRVEFIPKSYILVSSDHMPPLDHPDGLWQTSDGAGHVLA